MRDVVCLLASVEEEKTHPDRPTGGPLGGQQGLALLSRNTNPKPPLHAACPKENQ